MIETTVSALVVLAGKHFSADDLAYVFRLPKEKTSNSKMKLLIAPNLTLFVRFGAILNTDLFRVRRFLDFDNIISSVP